MQTIIGASQPDIESINSRLGRRRSKIRRLIDDEVQEVNRVAMNSCRQGIEELSNKGTIDEVQEANRVASRDKRQGTENTYCVNKDEESQEEENEETSENEAVKREIDDKEKEEED
eukprot:212402_1